MEQPDQNSLRIQRLQYQLDALANGLDAKLNQLLSEQRIQGIQLETMMDELIAIEERVGGLETSQTDIIKQIEALKYDSDH